MACPEGARFTAQAFRTAVENFDLWDAGFCGYATPLGELTVGTLFYGAVSLNIFLRTGSLIIPFILVLILGGVVLAQVYAVINSFAGLLIVVAAPIIATTLVYAVDRP